MKIRWGLAVAVAAICSVTWVSTVAIGRDAAGEGPLAALAAAVRDPLSLLAMRSPGARGEGALLSSKPSREPKERVLPTTREHAPPAAAPPAAPPGIDPELSFEGVDLTILSPVLEPVFEPIDVLKPEFEEPMDVVILLPPPGPFVPGGGGEVGRPPPPPAPAPEPATWAMMILGFFGAGLAIRRAGARRARPGGRPSELRP